MNRTLDHQCLRTLPRLRRNVREVSGTRTVVSSWRRQELSPVLLSESPRPVPVAITATFPFHYNYYPGLRPLLQVSTAAN